MQFLSELVKQYFLPGSMSFLLIGLLFGLILLYAGETARTWGRRWITALAIGYLLLSTSVVSNALVGMISGGFKPASPETIPAGVDGIVVLGGGGTTYLAGDTRVSALSESSTLRAIEAARIYQFTGISKVLVSGGTNEQAGLLDPESETMRDLLVDLGVPREKVILDPLSHNTYEHTANIPALLEENDIKRFILVTSPSHMRRAYLSFTHAGMDPIPSIAEEKSNASPVSSSILIFSEDALSISTSFFREVVGLIYYAIRGWI
jgi:uncharacterized SAM-binding protein YcdF (DUF218 family)